MPFRVAFTFSNSTNTTRRGRRGRVLPSSPAVVEDAVRMHHGGDFLLVCVALHEHHVVLADYKIAHAALAAASFPLTICIAGNENENETNGGDEQSVVVAASVQQYLGASGRVTTPSWVWDNRCLTIRNLSSGGGVEGALETIHSVLKDGIGTRQEEAPEHVLLFDEHVGCDEIGGEEVGTANNNNNNNNNNNVKEKTWCALLMYGHAEEALRVFDRCGGQTKPKNIVVLKGNVIVPLNALGQDDAATPNKCIDSEILEKRGRENDGATEEQRRWRRCPPGDVLRALAGVSEGTYELGEDNAGNVFIIPMTSKMTS